MKNIVQIIVFLAGTCFALAQSTFVVPNVRANTEGNSSTSDPFMSASFRFQQVYSASQFPSGGYINQIAFRLDGSATNVATMLFGNTTLILSMTSRSPDGLSSVFADNRSPDAVTVRSGGDTFGGNPPSPGSISAFDTVFTFDTPFFYNPGQGNLLIELAGSAGHVFAPGAMDAESTIGDSVSWVMAQSAFVSSGTASTLGLITQFEMTPVPEPSAIVLVLIGLGTWFFLKRK
jgi:hypothetical protein